MPLKRTRRHDGRNADEIRRVRFTRGFTVSPHGSVLIAAGKTTVLCTAMWQPGVPEWRVGKGSGWLTAEYDMLPGSTSVRKSRNRTKLDGRTQEIQRLIGRSLRAVVNLDKIGENTIFVDCDVLQADGGTRTAAVTGAFVALQDCVSHALKQQWLATSPIVEMVAATSVGRVDGSVVLDLDYVEDVDAEVDMNVVMTERGRFVEVQATGEETSFTARELDQMLRLAQRGVRQLLSLQRSALKSRLPRGDKKR